MNFGELRELVRLVESDGTCRITGTRIHGQDDYSAVVVDNTSGVPFTVDRLDQWEDRIRETKLYQEARND